MIRGQDCPIARLRQTGPDWEIVAPGERPNRDEGAVAAIKVGLRSDAIQVRPVTRRQVFVGGHPVGDTFE
jgi:hypothetical protein